MVASYCAEQAQYEATRKLRFLGIFRDSKGDFLQKVPFGGVWGKSPMYMGLTALNELPPAA